MVFKAIGEVRMLSLFTRSVSVYIMQEICVRDLINE